MTRGKMNFIRKNHRLSPYNYIGKKAFSITIAIHDRLSVFTTDDVVWEHISVLKDVSGKYHFNILAYCFMPDHVHILAMGIRVDSSLTGFLKNYKQVTAFRYKQKTGRILWQKSFYDHILRKDEDLRGVIQYILANPVRRGLVVSAGDYPYSGSFVYGRKVFAW